MATQSVEDSMNFLDDMKAGDPFEDAIKPSLEIGAYEYLWQQKGATFARIAQKFRDNPGALASEFVKPEDAEEAFMQVLNKFHEKGLFRFGTRLHHTYDYPERLREARHPIEMFYFLGDWVKAEKPSVAVVGSRKASPDGIKRAKQIARALVERGYTVVSGLASGIDTAALTGALDAGGDVIGVIGTPICDYYPKENKELQQEIARNHLLISQVPVLRYYAQDYRSNRSFFPERNATMSALTQATIIVEAGDTSGTLTQARAAEFQKRKLFIMQSCFLREDIKWPAEFEKRGAIRLTTAQDVWDNL